MMHTYQCTILYIPIEIHQKMVVMEKEYSMQQTLASIGRAIWLNYIKIYGKQTKICLGYSP